MSDTQPERMRHRVADRLKRVRPSVGMFRYSVAQYLIALALLIVTTPVVALFDQAMMIESAIFTLVLGFGAVAVGARRSAFLWAVILLAPALGGRWFNHLAPGVLPDWPFLTFTAIYMVFLLTNLFLFILRAPKVTGEVLCAGVATYLTIGLTFAVLYRLAEFAAPNSFSIAPDSLKDGSLPNMRAAYFSFITLATVGYGDIVPVSPTARMLAIVESTIGTFYVAIIIARLVSLYQVQRSDHV